MSRATGVTVLNDTTLTVNTSALDNATEYIAILRNLRVVDTANDTLTVPDSIRVSFTTAYGTPMILGSSVLESGGMMRCSDTLRVYFNQPLDSASTPTGALF